MEKIYILGGTQTDFNRNWTKEGKNFLAMFKEIVDDGLASVNLTDDDIVQLNRENKIVACIGNFVGEYYCNQSHWGSFLTEVNPAFYGVPSARYEAACASGSVAIDTAFTKLRAGDYEIAMVLGFEMMKTVNSKICGDYLGRAANYEAEAKGIEFPFPKLFGRLADTILEKYKPDKERFMKALAKIANKNYSNAKNNPNAQARSWFMDEAQANDRYNENNAEVGGLLAISDCSQVTDGAAVVFLATEEYAKEYCKKNGLKLEDIPYIKGWGHRTAPLTYDKKAAEATERSVLPWTKKAIDEAYSRSGMSVDDMDFFETHDCFTSSEYAAVSAFGITEPGREYEAIETGVTEMTGAKPINPSGGLIGCGHPVGASGVRMMLDLYKQVAGKAGGYQVNGAKNGMMLNIGGSATTNYVYVVGK
ncbi:MAG: acetyl-CoA acetyltransferase [Eubacteriales bacterium]|nr:acetyl-CoA acetyltransferase [Eubacteriales bacterium]